jgi:ketosteroid isomerase-like protein
MKIVKSLLISISFTLILLLVAQSAEARKRSRKRKIEPNPRTEIQLVLSNQQKAWNDGKLEAYMQGYWNNDSLTFIGKRGVTRGWKNTLANYKKSYPDKATMGKLQLQILSIKVLAKDLAFVVGKWDLTRSIGDVGGHFTLLMRNIKGRWVIVADHSS